MTPFWPHDGAYGVKMGSNLIFQPIFTKFAPEVDFCPSWTNWNSDFRNFNFLTPFWPHNGANGDKMGSNLIFGPIFTKFAPEVDFCPSWKNPKSAFWNFDLLRGQNGVKPYLSAYSYEIVTRGRFCPPWMNPKSDFQNFNFLIPFWPSNRYGKWIQYYVNILNYWWERS